MLVLILHVYILTVRNLSTPEIFNHELVNLSKG